MIECGPDACVCPYSDCAWRSYCANAASSRFIGPMPRLEIPFVKRGRTSRWRFVVELIAVPGRGRYLVSAQNPEGRRIPCGPMTTDRGDDVFAAYEQLERTCA